MLNLGPLAFAVPWALAALAALPILWWLLRVMPPAPRRIRFPAIRLLFGLKPDEKTPARTPPWLILLRMAVAALVITGMAQPLLNPQSSFSTAGPVVVVIDDGWASASGWDRRITAVEGLMEQARRSGKSVILATTAPPADGGPVATSGQLTPDAALERAQALQPKPWPVNRAAALASLEQAAFPARPNIFWLSDGIESARATTAARPERGAGDIPDNAGDITGTDFAGALQRYGPLTIMADPPERQALALLPPEGEGGSATGLSLNVLRPGGGQVQYRVRGLDDQGRILAQETASFAAGAGRAPVTLAMPAELRNRVTRIEIEGQQSAGAVTLLDEHWRRRPVGILTATADRAQEQPLLSEVFYLERALDPFADIHRGALRDLLSRRLAVLIVPDSSSLTDIGRDEIRSWVAAGGTLLRFAGPRLGAAPDDLTPVPLRRGDRSLGGAMSWAEPSRLSPFDAGSPLAGLDTPADVVVRRQVLAQPSLDLPRHTWARLTDGTPLVTGAARGRGQIVLVHTTANTDWSNLALSGLFVDMLRRVVRLSQGVAGSGASPLPPLIALDGFGRFAEPGAAAGPLPAGRDASPSMVGPTRPPGYYGTDDTRQAVNLAAGLDRLQAIGQPPSGVRTVALSAPAELDLKPWLLALAVALLLVDFWIALALRGLSPRLGRDAAKDGGGAGGKRAAGVATGIVVAAFLLATVPATAQTPRSAESDTDSAADRRAMEATFDTRLAYVITGDPRVDEVSRQGLEGLSRTLRNRSSVEPESPLPVDLDRHDISFFPFLYWPVTASQPRPGPDARERLANFIGTGGMILFDVRDRAGGPGFGGAGPGMPGSADLRRLLEGIAMPPLAPIPTDHILTRSFYLITDFPGRWTGGALWVENATDSANDGVSSVVIGSNDFAAAWATDPFGQPLYPAVPGGSRQREMSLRFGVNLVMYALTGNYKADQVHVPAILERLGQ